MAEGLPWFRADTNFPTNDKVLDLVGEGPRGKGAGFVYWCSVAWTQGHGTDGTIKTAVLPWVHGTRADAALLVKHGLWDVIEGGWRIHGFDRRNPVGAIQQQISEGLREQRAEAGRKGAAARWAKDEEGKKP